MFSLGRKATAYPDRINMGCGFSKMDGYLNVDSEAACEPDVLIVDNDFSVLPKGYFSLIFSRDVIEHIPRMYTMTALFDWVELLRVDGELNIQTSDIFGIIDVMRSSGDFETIHNWKRCLFGNQLHPGDWHYNGFTPVTLPIYLRAVGLEPGEIRTEDKWLIGTVARKTTDWSDLENIEDYGTFLKVAFQSLLAREPEEWRVNGTATLPGSPARRKEIRTLVTSEERLYMLGRQGAR